MNWRARLRAAVDASGRRQNAIAASAGVSQETLSRVLSGFHAQPAFDTVVRIVHALGENVGTLLDEPAFLLDGEQRAELRRVLGYLAGAARLSPPIDASSTSNAVAQPAADVPQAYYVRGARQVFQATGDSMIDAGIVDGDLLFVVPTTAVRVASRHIVVCSLGEITLARYMELHAGRVRLTSRNERYAAIDVDEESDFRLIGVVTGRLGNL